MTYNEVAAIIFQLQLENEDKWKQAVDKPALMGWFVGQAMKRTHGLHLETIKTILGIKENYNDTEDNIRRLGQ